MTKQRPLLLLILVAYIFLPTLYDWIMHPQGVWYKPFIVWALVIVVAYIMQNRGRHHDI